MIKELRIFLVLKHIYEKLKRVFLKRVFLRLPSSVAIERLFGSAGRIFQPEKATLTDNNFENQLLCFVNQNW